MSDDLLTGRVTSFRREQGFGVITLDDGRDVKFDASDCTMVPEEGASVLLRVGPAKWGGGFKALHVEPPSSTVRAAAPLTLDQQIATLEGELLVSTLSEQMMAQLSAEVFGGQIADAPLIDVLDAYYARDAAHARADGYLRHEADGAAGALLHDLAVRMPEVAIPRGLDVDSTNELVAVVNDVLRAADDPRRMYALRTGAAWCAYIVLAADRARRLASVLPFATPPQRTA